jgi:hypothetical protein
MPELPPPKASPLTQSTGQAGQCIQPMLGHGLVDALRPGQAAGVGLRLLVVHIGSAAAGRSLFQQLLTEPGQHALGVGDVESDHRIEVGRRHAAAGGEVGVEVVLELVHQHGELVARGLGAGRQFNAFNDLDTGRAQGLDGGIEALVNAGVETRQLPHHADPRAFECLRIECGHIVRRVLGDVCRGAVARVGTDQGLQQQGRIGDAARHRPGGVLAAADRHDAGAADQADARLDPDQAIDRRRADDAAVGLGADRGARQAGRGRDATA